MSAFIRETTLPECVTHLYGPLIGSTDNGGHVMGHVPLVGMLLLRDNPSAAPYFDAKYGNGLAALVMETH